ncbi:S8 family serine peptidase [Paraglaciecola sp.]|uniref:S8 family peptidase n=1 Tax=Paraglaciecola sp. TaxID=1920173 RepID=UPI0027402098|nr:S8 family serine peptidase [Paraglaciecola sp.]MDP5032508.1 S8 family serine peptidase [Paraglaciecola sp.]
MKYTYLALFLSLSYSSTLFSKETINLVVTQKDGNRKNFIINKDELGAFKNSNASSLIEKDILVATPKTLPKNYNSDLPPLTLDKRQSSLHQDFYAKSSNKSDYLPNDEYFDQQYYWQTANEEYLAYNNILASVRHLSPLRRSVVGIVDSGFYQHPDLIFTDGYSFTRVADAQRKEYFYIPEEFNNSPADRISNCFIHGTAVAGVATAIRDNSIGFAGIADADLIVARSLNCGLGFLSDTADAILWQLGQHVDDIRVPTLTADVINLSLGGGSETCPSYIQNSIDAANEQGVPVVVAIGNQQIDAAGFSPSNCQGVINVAAVSRTGDLFKTSNFGTPIDIAAFGDGVAGMTEEPNAIGYWDESSFATPIVTGVISNALSEFVTLNIDEIKFFLTVTALPFIAGQCDDSRRCGPGILDAEKFHLGLRDYRDGEILSFRPVLNNTQFCDKSLYATDNAELTRLCNTVELVLPKHQSNRNDIRFELLAFEKGKNLTFDNGSLVMSTQSTHSLLGDLNLDENNYGVRMCNSERCFGTSAIQITDLSQNAPAICN